MQGGGAQGAFTWGVLDRLLEEDFDIGRISGSSAGALNGAALATGLARGGKKAAKENLARLWDGVAQAGSLLSFLLLPIRKPGMGLWDDMQPLLSPYQVNPVGMAPLRHILQQVVDVPLLRQAGSATSLYVNAVHVQSGRGCIFGPAEMSIDALLASACAPLSFQAVEIDGQAYWDGSYAANPSLWPLYDNNLDTDILLVELTPLHRAETPMSAKNILNRINEVASLTGLLAELQTLKAVNRNVPAADIRLHALSIADKQGATLGTEPSIKRTVDRVLFEMLRQEGRRAAGAWLHEHGEKLGHQASVDMDARYFSASTMATPAAVAAAAAQTLHA